MTFNDFLPDGWLLAYANASGKDALIQSSKVGLLHISTGKFISVEGSYFDDTLSEAIIEAISISACYPKVKYAINGLKLSQALPEGYYLSSLFLASKGDEQYSVTLCKAVGVDMYKHTGSGSTVEQAFMAAISLIKHKDWFLTVKLK